MSTHTQLGTIAVPVGSYQKDGTTKKRFRNIGTLMKTEDGNGTRFWMKLNADILHASLYALIRSVDMDKGDDTFSANVFEQREPNRAAAPGKSADTAPDDDIPY